MPTLTEALIKSATAPEKGRQIITDDHRDAPRGFALRLTAAGGRAFVIRYKAEGRDRLMTVGEWPTWSLAAARKRAGELRRKIDKGQDPLAEKDERRQAPTVAMAVGRFCERTDRLKSGRNVRAALETHFVGELGSAKLKDVRRRDVIELIEAIAPTRPRQAALTLTYIKQLFAWAEDRELIEANPVATLRPAKIDKRLRYKPRDRVLTDAELRAFWRNVEHCGMSRLIALALKLVLVTGQRPGEVAGMRWDEIEGDTWTIPAERRGKTETAHVVPLSKTAQAILADAKAEVARLSKRSKRTGECVFETRPGGTPETNALARAVKKFTDQLGNVEPHWTPHDLRRTCRTGLAAAGVTEVVSEMVVGHTLKGISATYNLHRYDAEKRAALETWERRLQAITSGKPAEVIEMRATA